VKARQPVALVVAALMLLAPASASATNNAQFFFTHLAEQRLRPAPLVPTTAPRALSPVAESIETFDLPHGYDIQMAAPERGRPTALVGLQAGQYRTAGRALHTFRGAGFRTRSMRVRGRRGYLLTHGRDRVLLWGEGGVVYTLITSTPKTVSISELRATATGLDRLDGLWQANDELGYTDVLVAATSHTVTAEVEFTAPCVSAATGEPSPVRRATARVAFVPRQGDAFSFPIAPNLDPDQSGLTWQGMVSGTVGNGGMVNLRATAADSQDSCDTGPQSLRLGRYPR
jgi:hypothetical protein